VGQYKLLLTAEAMQRLAQIPKDRQSAMRKALYELASGEWEGWGAEALSGYSSWKEEEDHGEVFMLLIPDVGVLVWERAWSVDLFGRLAYPVGAYYERPPPPNHFAPHIVIRSLLKPEKTPNLRFYFDGHLYKEQPGLEHDEFFWQVEPSDEIAYTEELYLLSPYRIDDLLKGEQMGLPLHLSEEQISVLGVPGPALLSGEAGSGKTSVITQWLVINHLQSQEMNPTEPISQLFVTFSPRLRDHTRFEFETMLPKTARNHRTQFMTYRELLEEILRLAGKGNDYPSSTEMDFEKFMHKYAPKQPEIDPVLLWDEIRSVIKGGATSESDVFIDFARYEKLSEARGQCKTPHHLRNKYYAAAESYQSYLFRNGLWDGIDLVRACFRESEVAPKYEKIACDEVQDLAAIEIVHLFKLLKRKDIADLFFTGDVAQVINPSGFQWSSLKRELGKVASGKIVPDVNYLRRNYRSCFEIVNLVNKVLAIRRELLDDEVSKVEQIPLLPTRIRPMVLKSSPVDLLKSLESNPNLRLILTKTANEKANLEKLLGTAKNRVTILTVEEAKGLEYDGVLLWKFFLPRHETITKSDWELIFIPERRQHLEESVLKGDNPYELAYEFNLLHVGLTRARRVLFFFDENPKMRIANLGEEVAHALAAADSEAFQMHWKTEPSSPEDLREAGSRLLNRDTDQAYRLFRLGAEAFEKQGYFERAAECYDAATEYERAAKCYMAVGNKPDELKMLGRYHESLSQWSNAAKRWSERGQLLSERGAHMAAVEAFEEARQLFKQAKDLKSAAKSALSAAESVPINQYIDRAIKFAEAAYWAGEAKNREQAILALNNAIFEAERAKQDGRQILPGEPIEDWIAQQYFSMAQHENVTQQFAEAALAARKAAGLFKTISGAADYIHKRAYFESQYTKALALSVGSYVKAGETTQAANIQKELVNSFKGGIEEAKEMWNEFSRLYFDRNEYDQYVETVLELAELLGRRKEYSQVLIQLDEAKRTCEARALTRLILRLVEKKVEIAKATNDWTKVTDAYVSLSEIYEQQGNLRKAFENLQQAALACLNTEHEDKAETLFMKASKLSEKIMTPTESGLYCLNDVALEAYAVRKNFLSVTSWISRAASYFVHDVAQSTQRIQMYWEDQNQLASRLLQQIESSESSSRKRELEEMRKSELKIQGWIELAFAFLYWGLDQLSQVRTSQQIVKSWLDKAYESINKTEDNEAFQKLNATVGPLKEYYGIR
jgi:superfamily I DNA/RNA helicase